MSDKEPLSQNQFIEDLVGQLGGDDVLKFREVLDPHDFIFKYCYTLDPHDENCPVKLIPDHKYLHVVVDNWLVEKQLLLVKSRQMMVTWLMCALHLWDCMIHRGRVAFLVSKNENDANYSRELSLLSRVDFMYEKLPPHIKKLGYRIKTLKPACFKFPKMDSAIYGMSQDSDALRQYTATSVFWDEMAFHEHAYMAYAAVKPTLMGGGRLCGVSTPNGKANLFYDLVHNVKK